MNQKVAVGLVEKAGFLADVADNGEAALKAVENNDYDLVLMDCQMPVMDGYEATMRIRRQSRGRRIPIIAMTAHALAGDRERCLEAGMDDYLQKPLDREKLMAALDRWCPVNVEALPPPGGREQERGDPAR